MESRTFIFVCYIIVGLFFVLFNKKLGELNYKLVLLYTNKLKLKDVFIFKVDSKNQNSLLFLTRSFAVFFGLAIVASSLYYMTR